PQVIISRFEHGAGLFFNGNICLIRNGTPAFSLYSRNNSVRARFITSIVDAHIVSFSSGTHCYSSPNATATPSDYYDSLCHPLSLTLIINGSVNTSAEKLI